MKTPENQIIYLSGKAVATAILRILIRDVKPFGKLAETYCCDMRYYDTAAGYPVSFLLFSKKVKVCQHS